MGMEQLEVREYGDLINFRSNYIKDTVSGITLAPYNGSLAQLRRAISWELNPDNTDYLYRYEYERPHDPRKVVSDYMYILRRPDTTVIFEIVLPGGEIIGNAGYHSIDLCESNRMAALRILIDKPYWGRGAGKTVIAMLLDYAKLSGFDEMHAIVHWDNVRSVDVFRWFGIPEKERNDPWLHFSIPLRSWVSPGDVQITT